MLCISIDSVKAKSGKDWCIVNCIGRRRSTGSLFIDKIWVSPDEIMKNNLSPGDQFRAFKDGGILVDNGMSIDMRWVSDIE